MPTKPCSDCRPAPRATATAYLGTALWLHRVRQSSRQYRRAAAAPGSSAPLIPPLPGGWRDRPHHIGGMLGRRQSDRLRDHEQRLADLISARSRLHLGRRRSGNSAGLNDLQQGSFDGVIDSQATEGDTAQLTILSGTSLTGIARNVVMGAAVADRQFTAASTTADKTGKQGVAMLGRSVMPARCAREPIGGQAGAEPSLRPLVPHSDGGDAPGASGAYTRIA
jgi:hypothetical protein